MRKYIYYIAAFAAIVFASSCCKMMNEALEAEIVEPIKVAYTVDIKNFTAPDGTPATAPAEWYNNLEAVFNNFSEGIETVVKVGSDGIAMAEVIPGVYNITVRSTQKYDGKSYILNGLAQNVALTENVTTNNDKYTISIQPLLGSPLCIREMYYTGSLGGYFRDQFYEIYNNGEEVVYLDHICLAHLVPEYATASLPQWPEEDGVDKYAYAVTLWQIQGDGDDYPLQPGESVVLAQEAADHTKIETWAGFGLVNTAKVEWECWSGNEQRINDEVPNLPYVFWSGYINKMQWLTSVDGSAMALYQPGQNLEFGSDYWQLGTTTQHKVGSSQQYVRIPVGDIYDAVECIPTSADLDMKRIPGILDSGATSVDGYNNGKSVSRKVIDYREDGSPIFQDTNNSTADFEVCDAPMIRRHNVKRPAWSPWAE